MFGKYTKSIFAALSSFGLWWGTASADGDISKVELYGLVGIVVTGLVVAGTTNTVDGKPYIDPSTLTKVNAKQDKES